jgi:hypothetical protein
MTIRHLLAAGAAIAALSVSACATAPAVSPVDQGKAVIALDATFDAATLAVETALKAGVLKGVAIATAREDLARANAARKAAEAAYAAGNATSTAAQISAFQALVADLEALTGASIAPAR